jgi:predicted NBD/HSP70 family sugar kinase
MRGDGQGRVVGIDLGGTKVAVAVATLSGAVIDEAVEPTDRRGGLHVVEQIGALAERLGGGSPAAAAMAAPGVLDAASGAIRLAPNLAGFDRIDVLGAMARRLGCPVRIENDVNMAALGEHRLGGGGPSFAFVAIGTGIGMGLVVDGTLLRGARGAAGEISHLPIGGDPWDADAQVHGCFESAVASRGILARYRCGGGEAGSVAEVFDRLAEGEPAAAAVIEETARLLVLGLVAVQAVVDPERVVLGGSIGARAELVERVQRLGPAAGCVVRIDASALASRAALLGAVAVAAEGALRTPVSHRKMAVSADAATELPL